MLHKQYCGVPNHSIHENFQEGPGPGTGFGDRGSAAGPVGAFITDTDENLSAIADFMLENGVKNMQILPYNPIWLDKLPRFGSVQRLDFGEGQASSCRTRSLTAVRRFLSPEVFTSIVTGDVSAQTAGAFLISLYL